MLHLFGAYIKTIAAFLIFSAFAEIIMPDNKYKKYISIVLGFLMIATIMKPLGSILGSDKFEFINLAKAESSINLEKSTMPESEQYYSNKQNEFVTEIYKKSINEDIKMRIINENINIVDVKAVINEDYNDAGYGEIVSISVNVNSEESEDTGSIVKPVDINGYGESGSNASNDVSDETREIIIQSLNEYYKIPTEKIEIN